MARDDDDEVYDMKPQRYLNVMPTLRSGKSEAQVTIIKDSARGIILLRPTTDGHKISRSLSATTELLVIVGITA